MERTLNFIAVFWFESTSSFATRALPAVIRGQLLDHRRNHAAWCAPRCPEIHHCQALVALNLSSEIVISYFHRVRHRLLRCAANRTCTGHERGLMNTQFPSTPISRHA